MRHTKRLFMLSYVVAFALVDATTTVFIQYPALKWVGLAGVLAVFVETARCAYRNWETIREESQLLSSS